MMVDLHLHTTASDGALSPSELVEKAYENGIKVISITDHDTIDGISEGRDKAFELGMEFISGIEISCDWKGKEIHILGYFIDFEDDKFINEISELKNIRVHRNEKMLKKLNENKIQITMEELKKEAGGGVISRAHMANIIMKKGYAYSKREAFSRYLGHTGIAYVPKENLSPERAVKIIKENGGIVSLAHPKFITKDRKNLVRIIESLKKEGLDALEVYHGKFVKKDVEDYISLAEDLGLICTGGSDFHGNERDVISIGDGKVPMNIYENLLAYYERSRI